MDLVEMTLSDREFGRIKERVYRIAGLSLSDSKRTLVVSRLSKIVRGLGLSSFDAYVDFLEKTHNAHDQQNFVNALTTNLTRFYREDHHFEHLEKYVGNLLAQRPRSGPDGKPRLRIWSAGCSTGQEPYTIALCLLAAFPDLKRWDFRILATDIDTDVIAKAAQGIYPASELNDLSSQRAALFEKLDAGSIRIPAAARQLVAFKPLNLMEEWPMKGAFDAIFCRNVAIYFDRPTQTKLFQRLGKALAPDGFLYIGHSENLGSGADGFKSLGKTIFQVKSGQRAKDAA
ncbi:MAG TPA: protein-glutamate O-methyltransferase CheR [Arsenicitalea sp.]|jgi:chemotaxis protein methyltransferase CheR|nr:protein-glutamate O-methyltransferase CheR [Arsenicitalea sp.]